MRLLRLWLPAALWATVILWAANDSFSAGQSREWLVRFAGHTVPQWLHFTIRKLAHVFEYAVLSFLAFRAAAGSFPARNWRTIALTLLVCLTVATADEYRQSRSKLRRGHADDVALDVLAAALTAMIVRNRHRTLRQGDDPG